MRAILNYHSIDESGSVLALSPEVFAGQMRWLARSGIRVVSVDTIGAADLGADAVALTFDDGLESFAHGAWPVLADLGLAATLYVVTGLAGGVNAWDASAGPRVPKQRLLDWDAIGRLSERGVAIGSHSRTHPDLAVLAPAQLDDEIERSQRDIHAAIGVDATSFAYPFGSVSDEAVRRVRRCYRTACTAELRGLDAGDDAHLLPRLDMYYFRKPGQLEGWGSSWFRTRLRMRAYARVLRRGITPRRLNSRARAAGGR